jgi:nicotinate-nucleotide adenylyltransferase
VQGQPGIEVSRVEIDRGGPSYTIETVEALRAEAARLGRPAPEIFLVVGADLVESLPTWERVDELRQLVTLVVVSRPRSPAPPDPAGWRVEHLDGGGVDVSSSEVRALLAQGGNVNGLLPDAVIHCISRRGMYAVHR